MTWNIIGSAPPKPEEHDRVLIYTEGVDFNGVQVFDVKTENLHAHNFEDPDDQPEECRMATHWAVRPNF